MRNNLTSFIALLIILISSSDFGQNDDVKELISKEWKLEFYEESGEFFPPSSEQKNDKMIFYDDYTVKSIEVGQIQNGVWSFDVSEKLLSITDNETKEVTYQILYDS